MHWRAISQELHRQDLSFDFEYTSSDCRGDLLVQKAIAAGYRHIIAVGGDGHLHDLVNGILSQHDLPSRELTIAMISQGTGNDWIRTNGVPRDYAGAIALIKQGRTYYQNAGLAKAFFGGRPVQRYFHNFAGVGFDATVVQQTTGIKNFGQAAYLFGMLRCLYRYRRPVLRISLDNTVIESPTYLAITGIGRYGGGGMKLIPLAQPDSEHFSVSVAKIIPKSYVVCHIGKLYDGSFIDHPQVETHFSSRVKIEVLKADQEVFMEADGDLIGSGPFEISLIPKALKVIIP